MVTPNNESAISLKPIFRKGSIKFRLPGKRRDNPMRPIPPILLETMQNPIEYGSSVQGVRQV